MRYGYAKFSNALFRINTLENKHLKMMERSPEVKESLKCLPSYSLLSKNAKSLVKTLFDCKSSADERVIIRAAKVCDKRSRLEMFISAVSVLL